MSVLSGQADGPTWMACQTYGGLKEKLVVEPRNAMQSMDKNGKNAMYQIKGLICVLKDCKNIGKDGL